MQTRSVKQAQGIASPGQYCPRMQHVGGIAYPAWSAWVNIGKLAWHSAPASPKRDAGYAY